MGDQHVCGGRGEKGRHERRDRLKKVKGWISLKGHSRTGGQIAIQVMVLTFITNLQPSNIDLSLRAEEWRGLLECRDGSGQFRKDMAKEPMFVGGFGFGGGIAACRGGEATQ